MGTLGRGMDKGQGAPEQAPDKSVLVMFLHSLVETFKERHEL